MIPFAIVFCSGLLAVLRSVEIISSTVTMVCLFTLSILAPIFSMFTVVGWCVGRTLFSSGSLVVSISEGIALLPGVLLLPMMLRNLVGPRMRSRPWEYFLALELAPFVAALAYRNWLLHFSDVTGSLSRKIVSTFGGTYGSRVLGETSESNALIVGALMAMMVMLIAVMAVRFTDMHGQPVLMFRRFVKVENPTQVLRRAYVDSATIELGEPTRWGTWMRYGLAGLLSTYALSEVLGLRSILLVLIFLTGIALAKNFDHKLMKNEVHPIAKTIPMVGVGLLLGTISVSPNRVFISFAIVAVLAVASSVIRSRSLWDA
jgi:hypothetical protein